MAAPKKNADDKSDRSKGDPADGTGTPEEMIEARRKRREEAVNQMGVEPSVGADPNEAQS